MAESKVYNLIGYARVSTEEQVLEGNSLDAQVATIAAWCRGRGHALQSVVREAGKSGTLPPSKRDGLQSALNVIRAGEADGLIFVKLDRLSRRLRDLSDIKDESEKGRWHIVSCHDQIDTTSAMGRFQLHMMGALAELEVDRISERVIHGLQHLTLQGRVHTPRTPFGFRLGHAEGDFNTAKRGRDADGLRTGPPDKRPLVEHPGEQAILAFIMDHMDQGGTAYSAAKNLTKHNVRHPRGGCEWLPGTILSIYQTAVRRREIFQHHGRL